MTHHEGTKTQRSTKKSFVLLRVLRVFVVSFQIYTYCLNHASVRAQASRAASAL